MTDLDYDDPDVRRMLRDHHQPDEVWNSTSGTLISVHCGMCGQAWPCEVKRKLKAIQREKYAQWAALSEYQR